MGVLIKLYAVFCLAYRLKILNKIILILTKNKLLTHWKITITGLTDYLLNYIYSLEGTSIYFFPIFILCKN